MRTEPIEAFCVSLDGIHGKLVSRETYLKMKPTLPSEAKVHHFPNCLLPIEGETNDSQPFQEDD